MNKQNLLSNQYLLKYYIGYFIKILINFSIPVIILFFGFQIYTNYLDKEIISLKNQIYEAIEDKRKYDTAKKEIEELEEILRTNQEKLNYVKSLHGDFSQFDLLMSYLINMKPYDLTLISLEDIDIVPPPNQTSSIVNKDTISDIFDGTVPTQPTTPEVKEEILSTEQKESNVEEPLPEVNDSVISSENPGDEWNSDKFDNSLVYTRDISLSNILIRGYATNVSSVAEYVDIVSKAPEIDGYTLEGVEDKVTIIEGTNIILFEIKLKMKGVLNNAQ